MLFYCARYFSPRCNREFSSVVFGECALSRRLVDIVVPNCSNISTRSSVRSMYTQPDFVFGAAFSKEEHLTDALREVVEQTFSKLQGRKVDICQVLVSSEYGSLELQRAPQLTQALLALHPGGVDTHIIGGAVQGCIAGEKVASRQRCVSMMLASLPGVKIIPFAVTKPSLPDLSREQWMSLLQPTSDQTSLCTILFSTAHFKVDRLLRLLNTALPNSPVLGGVLDWKSSCHFAPGLPPALTGASGVILQGDFEVDTLSVQGCRGVGPWMLVTERGGCEWDVGEREVGDGPRGLAGLELDHQAAESRLQAVVTHQLTRQDQITLRRTQPYHKLMIMRLPKTPINPQASTKQEGEGLAKTSVSDHHLVLGVDECVSRGPPEGVRVGACLRMAIRDRLWARRQTLECVKNYVQSREESRLNTSRCSISNVGEGGLVYGWRGAITSKAPAFHQALPHIPLQGCLMNKVFGPLRKGGPSYIHDYGSSYGVLRAIRRKYSIFGNYLI